MLFSVMLVVITKVPPLAKTAALTASKLENIVASLNSEVIAVAAVSESFVGVKPVRVWSEDHISDTLANLAKVIGLILTGTFTTSV